jgi:hypothetical protein
MEGVYGGVSLENLIPELSSFQEHSEIIYFDVTILPTAQ